MSVTTPPRPPTAPPLAWVPERVPGLGPEPEVARRTRLRQRRRLLLWSLPLVLVALGIAAKLLSMGVIAEQTRAAYLESNQAGVANGAERLGVLNVVERHKAPFAAGDAFVLAGDFDGARARFEEALSLAPVDAVEACQIRVNLALSLERLGDAAKVAGRADEATTYFDRVAQVVAEAPPGCFEPPAGDAGRRLSESKSRADEKRAPAPQPPDPGQPSQPDPAKQEQLDRQTKQNQESRQQSGPDGQQSPDNSPPSNPNAKPW